MKRVLMPQPGDKMMDIPVDEIAMHIENGLSAPQIQRLYETVASSETVYRYVQTRLPQLSQKLVENGKTRQALMLSGRRDLYKNENLSDLKSRQYRNPDRYATYDFSLTFPDEKTAKEFFIGLLTAHMDAARGERGAFTGLNSLRDRGYAFYNPYEIYCSRWGFKPQAPRQTKNEVEVYVLKRGLFDLWQ